MTAEILLTTYNGEKYLREQIESILRQDCEDWHLTISDDMSEDKTKQIIQEYCGKYKDRISEYVSGIRFGNARDHFFHLMKHIDAEVYMLCDQDDVWNPDKISLTKEKFAAAENECGKDVPILVFTDLVPTDRDLKVIHPSLMAMQDQDPFNTCFRSLIFQNVVTGCTVMFNKALAEKAVRYQNSDAIIMHDWWLALAAAAFGVIRYLPKKTVQYRQHEDNTLGAVSVVSLKYYYDALVKYGNMRQAVIAKKQQAGQFLISYEEELREEDRQFLKEFSQPRSGAGFYLKNRSNIHGLHRLLGLAVLEK